MEKKITDKKPRGGKRDNAGRKKTKEAMRSYRFAKDVCAILDKQPDQTAYIEDAVREKDKKG